MNDVIPRLYLASQSPRRAELLRQIGIDFAVIPVDVDESVGDGDTPTTYVERLALAKAKAGWQSLQGANAPVLGSDTTVVLGKQILGKPADIDEARAMLRALSGGQHEVLTAVALVWRDRQRVAVSRTEVGFRELSDNDIDSYCASGEPMGKAGAYAIQGFAAVFVDRIVGSYSGVVGLPLAETYSLLLSLEREINELSK